MATAYHQESTKLAAPTGFSVDDNLRFRRTIEQLVEAFAVQDIEKIMTLFAADAVYCDILGKDQSGDEYRGKAAIKQAFARQFDLSGHHTFENAHIMVNGNRAFASWTLVLGDTNDPRTARFDGIDEFCLNDAAKVVLKKAWLKGQPRLRQTMLRRSPTAMFRHLGYALKSWGK